MPERQHTTPMIIKDKTAMELERLPFTEKTFNEDQLQELLFAHPALLPITEIEPVFAGPIPVVRELRTGAGPVDLFYINSNGFMTIVETKLWRNPEARRQVVAQIIDYAKDMAQWTYQDLVEALQKSDSTFSGDPLIELACEDDDDFEEANFIDRVAQNLRLGRFLLMIVGDGIQEGVEQMAKFLQQTPQLGYTLALIEIALFRLNAGQNDPLYVQPRIIARTQEITRAVIEVKEPSRLKDITVTIPDERGKSKGHRKSITEADFLEELEKSVTPEVIEFAKSALSEAKDHDLEIKWGGAGPLFQYVDGETGEYFTFGQLYRHGTLTSTERLFSKCQKLKLPPEIWRDYFDEVAELIPEGKRRRIKYKSGRETERIGTETSGIKGGPPLEGLAPHKKEWFNAIDKAVERIRVALDSE